MLQQHRVSLQLVSYCSDFQLKEGVLTPKHLQLAKKFVYAPGEGASKEATRHEYFECHAVATADEDELNPRRAFAKLRWEGSLYRFSGVWYVYISEHHLPHPYPNMIPMTTFQTAIVTEPCTVSLFFPSQRSNTDFEKLKPCGSGNGAP